MSLVRDVWQGVPQSVVRPSRPNEPILSDEVREVLRDEYFPMPPVSYSRLWSLVFSLEAQWRSIREIAKARMSEEPHLAIEDVASGMSDTDIARRALADASEILYRETGQGLEGHIAHWSKVPRRMEVALR